MLKGKLFLTVFSILLLFSFVTLFAQNNVEIKFNNGDKLYIGENNRVEVWIQNENNLSGAISLGFEFAWDPSLTMNFIPHGSYPAVPISYVAEENDAIGVWNVATQVYAQFDGVSPETILIGGSALASPGLPADPVGRMCYSMMLYIPAGQAEVLNGFSVDNVFVPPSGGWLFNEGAGGFPPDFHGEPNSSTSNPDAPAVFFDVVERVNNNVEIKFNGGRDSLFIGQNNLVVIWVQNENDLSGAMSLGLEFAWDPSLTMNFVTPYGSDPHWSPYINHENDAVGVWNLSSGVSISIDGISPDTVLVGGAALASVGLPADPIGRMCYSMMLYIPAGQNDVIDGFSVDNIFVPPGGGWIFNEGTGGYPPDFHGYSNTSTGNPDAPPVFFDVVTHYICGDPDNSDMIDISDVVYIIYYIFAGGPAPQPVVEAGDADCTGMVDISDALYIRNYIFYGGPAPCDCEPPYEGDYNVSIHLNGGDDVLYIGESNTIEFWFENLVPLHGVSLGFEFQVGVDYQFQMDIGSGEPVDISCFYYYVPPIHRIDQVTPDSLFVNNAGPSPILPAHEIPTHCITMVIDIPAGESELSDGFCIDNIIFPPAGNWIFNDGLGGFPPDFQGNSNFSVTMPSAPPACFDIVLRSK